MEATDWAHRQNQSATARFTGEWPPFCAMSPQWHHLKITGKHPHFVAITSWCQTLVNAVYNPQETSASDTKPSPLLTLDLPEPGGKAESAHVRCCPKPPLFLRLNRLTGTQGVYDQGRHAETPGCQPYFSSSCSIHQLLWFAWLYSSVAPIQRLSVQLPPSMTALGFDRRYLGGSTAMQFHN